MPVFKFVISHGKQSVQVEKDQKDAPVFGKKLGDAISGDFLGLTGYELLVTGGSDKDGFPMRSDIEGALRKRFLLTKGTGFNAPKGLRRRKMLRGNSIAADVVQINLKVVKAGSESVEKLLGIEVKEEVKEKKIEVSIAQTEKETPA